MKRKFCILFACLLAVTNVTFAADINYTIIVDAGSTSSRLHLFQYHISTSVPLIKEIFSARITPGISAYANNPQAVTVPLKTLFDDVLIQLKANKIDPHTVSVSILATAGMRLLPIEQQQVIYNALIQLLKTNYPFVVADVKTLSGKMEGVYAWLDVNYLANNFQAGVTTVGAIDMGGASTQIAYATDDKSKSDAETTFLINHQLYTIFSVSFLGFGQDQAREAIGLSGYADACYPLGYKQGAFNYNACEALFSHLIQANAIAAQLLPVTTQQQFIAFSGIYYDYHDFLQVESHPDQIHVETAIVDRCSQTWDQLKASTMLLEKYLAGYCANSVYFDELLYKTYSLQDKQLIVTNTINHQLIDWTLGSVLFSLIEHS